jgi:hypothetical protein
MSIMLLAAKAGYTLENVAAATGGALQSASNHVELQVNEAATIVNDAGTTRPISKSEVLLILELFEQYIVRMDWPYAAS